VVLNGTRSGTRVSEATRGRIRNAARELGYHPNAVARGLSRRRMDTVGVVFPAPTRHEVNLYYTPILNGILEVATERRQYTTLCTAQTWPDVEQNLPTYCDGRCDGLLLIGPPAASPIVSELRKRHIPFVLINDTSSDPDVSTVDVDNIGGAFKMVSHLLELGHRRIAFLGGDSIMNSSAQRAEGYRRAFRAAGLEPDGSLMFPGYYWRQYGYDLTRHLMGLPAKSQPTAIFCAGDDIAFGALDALIELGLKVPDDMSVAGFDDILTAALSQPPLTTVRQPHFSIGRRAAEILLDQIQGTAEGAQKDLFSPELVLRRTVGPPANIEEAASSMSNGKVRRAIMR
jgi:LacI family transcriptional regulator